MNAIMGRNKSFEVTYTYQILAVAFFSPKYVWTFEFRNSDLRTFYNFSHVWLRIIQECHVFASVWTMSIILHFIALGGLIFLTPFMLSQAS